MYHDALYVMGGCRVEGKTVSEAVMIYSGSWLVAAVKLPLPLYYFQVCVVQDSLLIFGGLTAHERESRGCYLYMDTQFREQSRLPECFAPVFSSYCKVSGDEVFAFNDEGVLFSLAASSWIALAILN
jgi:hypothetical protein